MQEYMKSYRDYVNEIEMQEQSVVDIEEKWYSNWTSSVDKIKQLYSWWFSNTPIHGYSPTCNVFLMQSGFVQAQSYDLPMISRPSYVRACMVHC